MALGAAVFLAGCEAVALGEALAVALAVGETGVSCAALATFEPWAPADAAVPFEGFRTAASATRPAANTSTTPRMPDTMTAVRIEPLGMGNQPRLPESGFGLSGRDSTDQGSSESADQGSCDSADPGRDVSPELGRSGS